MNKIWMQLIKTGLILLFFAPGLNALSQPGYSKPGPVKTPTIFAEGIISTGDYETHPAFTPSGDTLFFLKGAPDFSTWTICVSYFKNGKWTAPQVAPFSGKYMDADPFVTKEGKEVYFISNRPIHEGDSAKVDEDIWKVIKTTSGWNKPIHLEAPINTNADEYYPTITDNGVLYFGSERPGGKGGCDIYKSKFENGKYSQPENLGDAINTADNEYEPFISSDEKYLIYMATRPNGLKNADLFISYNKNGQWTKAAKLPAPFNTTATEWSPIVTRDGKYFFFGSTRNKLNGIVANPENINQLNNRISSAGNGLGDIYQVDFSAINSLTMNVPDSTHFFPSPDFTKLNPGKIKFTTSGDLDIQPSIISSEKDFDYLVGKWNLENRRLKLRLNNCKEWDEFEFTVENMPLLEGQGNMDICRRIIDGKPWQGIAMRMFNSKTKLWSIYWTDSNSGGIFDPPMIGSFDGPIGKFYCKDKYKGKDIIVLFHWDKTDPENPVWSQAFSSDNGKNWEWNFTNVSRRIK